MMYVNVMVMTGYTVKLFTFDARIESIELLADDASSAAGAAVWHFMKLGEDVERATAIVVERGDSSSFAVSRPRDVLAGHHQAEGLPGAIGMDSVAEQPSRDWGRSS
jgi:hypothetical protein